MPRVVHFEVVASDPERAVKFYKDVFGWNINKWDKAEYWMVDSGKEGPGINGGIVRSKGEALSVNTIDVPNLEDYLSKVTANGGEVVVPKHAIPSVGYLAYCKDTEGIVFGLMQMDDSAK